MSSVCGKAQERAEGAQKERCDWSDWSDWTDSAQELQNRRARMRASCRQRFVSEDQLSPHLSAALVGRMKKHCGCDYQNKRSLSWREFATLRVLTHSVGITRRDTARKRISCSFALTTIRLRVGFHPTQPPTRPINRVLRQDALAVLINYSGLFIFLLHIRPICLFRHLQA